MGETDLPLRLAALLAPYFQFSGRLEARQKRPQLAAVAESLAFAIADALDEAGQLSVALHVTPVDPNDVAVHGLAFPGCRRASRRYRLAGYGSHTDSVNGEG